MEAEKLKKAFRIDIPVEVVRTGESQIILDPSGKRARIEYLHKDELFEAFAGLRLGLDYSPLLTTFYFQRNLSEEEARYAVMFSKVITPVIKAWTYRNALRYVERERVEREVREIIEEMTMVHMWRKAESPPEHHERGIYTATAYLIGKVMGFDVKAEFIGEEAESWRRYLELLEGLVEKTPSPYLLTKIPPVIKAPYKVRVRKVPYPHYEVRRLPQK